MVKSNLIARENEQDLFHGTIDLREQKSKLQKIEFCLYV